jgi:hypothetical protein
MGKKMITLTPQGHRVMGALATYIVPKLAADQSLQSVELEALCKSITPGRYDRQIDGIVGTVKERFGSRIAQDESFADLRKVLTALMPVNLAMDIKSENEEITHDSNDDSDDDSNDSKKAKDEMDSEDAEFKAWKKAKDAKKAKDKKKDEDEEEDDDDDEEGEGEDAANKNKNDPDLKNEEGDMDDKDETQWVKNKKSGHANGQDAFPSKKALDQALDAAREEGAELAISRMGARFEAAALVKPVVGKIDPYTTSATKMYKMALDEMAKTHKGIDLAEIPPIAYKGVFKALMATDSNRGRQPNVRLAQDSAKAKTLSEKYTHIPDMA